jgi:ABC-type Fe3+/spermidine/putrescine transport system ATPase subunit
VLQVGPPRELYERPRTRFVADFVGTNNLVPGEVQGGDTRDATARSGELLVSTALGPLRAIASGAHSGRCVLAVRPENVAVGGARAGDGNRVAGRISLISYLGNTLRYDVETEPGLVLKADIRDPWHHDPLPLGRPVTLSFPPSVTLAVSDDA